MSVRVKKIASFLLHTVLKPLLILFFSMYHAAFMLAAPVMCARLSIESNTALQEQVRSLFRTLFPENIGGAGLFLAVGAVLALIAYAILVGAIAVRIPFAIVKWNIAHLAGLLYGNALRSLPYIMMMAAPALYFAVSFILDPRRTMPGLLEGMVMTVAGQYGGISLVALVRAARDLCPASDGGHGEARRSPGEIARAILPGAAVILLAAPLLAIAAVSYRSGSALHASPARSALFHAFIFLSIGSSVAFYLRHYGEFLALLAGDDGGEG